MGLESATIMVIEIGSLFVFFLLMPLVIVLSRIWPVWQTDRGNGVVLGGVIIATGFLFILFAAAFGTLAAVGTPGVP